VTEIALGTFVIIALTLVLTLIILGTRAALAPDRAVEITLNGQMTVVARSGEKLLAALNGQGVRVPSACAGAGTCGLCKVKILSGGGTPLSTERARLSRRELRDGQRLACQVVIREPLAVTVSDDILSAESWETKVLSNAMLAPLIKELVLEVPSDEEFTFRAGAYIQAEIPEYETALVDLAIDPRFEPVWQTMGWRELVARNTEATQRAYSMASRPDDRGRIVLNVRLAVPPPGGASDIPPGVGSSYLFSRKPGDIVAVSGPFGDFHVQSTEREMIFIGGGVGMAPLRAMIHEQLAAGSKRKMSYWYGARSAADIFYRDEFTALAASHDNFSWTVALSEPAPEDDWQGPVGFIHDVVLKSYLQNHPAPQDCEYYLCGPPLMIQAVLAMLDACGVEPGSIFNDDFGI